MQSIHPQDTTVQEHQLYCPDEILIAIFSWIHPKDVFKYRRASHRIDNLLTSAHFAKTCLRRFSRAKTLKAIALLNGTFMLAPSAFQSVYAELVLNLRSEISWTYLHANPPTHRLCARPGIPPAIGLLEKLIHLELFPVQGSIPHEIGGLVSLEVLNLSHNNLTGEIPVELCKLSNLKKLNLSHCVLSGPLPDTLGQMTSLIDLSVHDNKLTGSIPSSIGLLSSLEAINLSSNRFSNEIPAEIGKLENLTQLYLDENEFSGSIPREFGKLRSLEELHLNSNQLSGPIPQELLLLNCLTECDMRNNAGLTCAFELAGLKV
ncbi:hypothetical protein HDU79_004206 [Rhizoclosmatium sp. JEL0117]|nr:hypothetical protein HDU79_004206 [Rhizoclosmatium sp. JEL0117]